MKYAVKPYASTHANPETLPEAVGEFPVMTLEMADDVTEAPSGWELLDDVAYALRIARSQEPYSTWLAGNTEGYYYPGPLVTDTAIANQFDGVKTVLETTDPFVPGSVTFYWNGTPCVAGRGLVEHGVTSIEIEADAWGVTRPPKPNHQSWATYRIALRDPAYVTGSGSLI